jgi:hypothetical protein
MKRKIYRNLLAVFFGLLCLPAWAAPTTMRFQGRLTDSQGRPIAGSPQVKFEVYDAATNGVRVWGPSSYQSVNSNDAGLFSVDIDLGANGGTVFSGSNDLYLQVTVKSGTGGIDQILSPRQHLSNVPYAFYSQIASSATTAGVANSVTDNSISNSKIQDDAVTSSKIMDRSITAVDIGLKAVLSSNIGDQEIKNLNIEDETITPSKMNISSFTNAGWIVPQGAIFLFLGASCPAGYEEVTEFRNRFAIGADIAGADPLVPDSPDGVIANTLKHKHNVATGITYGGEIEAFSSNGYVYYPGNAKVASTAVNGSPVSGVRGRDRPFDATITNETEVTPMPPGLTALFCRKQ